MKKFKCLRCGATVKKENRNTDRVRCDVCGGVGVINERGFVVPLYESEDAELDDVTLLGNKYTLKKYPKGYKIEGSKLVGFKKRFTKSVEVPDGVTEIGEGVFANAQIDRVVLPASVVKVGAHAFEGSSVSEVVIAGEVKEVGNNAFAGCKNLLSIAFKTGLERVNSQAFAGSGLITVCLPSTLVLLGEGAFKGCESLIHTGLRAVKYIGTSAYEECNSIEEVCLPAGVKTLGESAFANCASLKKVVLPDGLKAIGNSAFYYCCNLLEVRLPADLEILGDGRSKYGVFEECINLHEIELGKSVTEFGRRAFSGCVSLAHVTLPPKLTALPDGVFGYCESIREMDLPPLVTSIGVRAFADSGIKRVSFGKKLKSIGAYAFAMTLLDTVVIPQNTTEFGEGAFMSCLRLRSASVKSAAKELPTYMFANCSALTELALEKHVTSLGESFMANCSSLGTLKLPAALEEVGDGAVYGCERLSLPIKAKLRALNPRVCDKREK